jgi:hypothetical protein
MVKEIDPEVRDTYNLEEWSPEALERLRRFVQILNEWDTKDSDRRDGVNPLAHHDSEDSSTPPHRRLWTFSRSVPQEPFSRVVGSTEPAMTVTKSRR